MVTNPQEPQDNEEIPEAEELNTEDTKTTYESLVTLEPERPIDLSKFNPPKTIEEEEEDAGTMSDFKAFVRSITPKFANPRLNALMQTAMPSRIFPDNYMDKHFLIAAALMEEDMDKEDYDPIALISQTQDGLSIGYEGRHIVEIMEGYGVTREQDLDKLANTLGLG